MKNTLWIGCVLVAVMTLTSSCAKLGGRDRTNRRDLGLVDGLQPGLIDELQMGGERFEGEEVRGQFDVVYFDYDSSQVKFAEQAKIERVADAMRMDSRLQIVVEGHCDERGSAEYNLALGERRALAIRSFLVGLGADAARLQTRSFGEEMPAAAGSDEEAWRQNRRGEFVVIR